MKRVLSIFLEILKYVFIVFLIVYLVFIAIHRISIDRSVFGYRVYTVSDNTMAKVYNLNDIILVKDVNAKKLKVGDDIAYKGNTAGLAGKVVFHRIVKIKNEKGLYFITRGVNSKYNDPAISSSNVIGKVVGILPVINEFHRVLKTQIGFFIFIFLPVLLIILKEMFHIISDINIETEEKVKEEINKNKKKKSILEQDDGEIEIL